MKNPFLSFATIVRKNCCITVTRSSFSLMREGAFRLNFVQKSLVLLWAEGLVLEPVAANIVFQLSPVFTDNFHNIKFDKSLSTISIKTFYCKVMSSPELYNKSIIGLVSFVSSGHVPLLHKGIHHGEYPFCDSNVSYSNEKTPINFYSF